jgi:hypothetical protein
MQQRLGQGGAERFWGQRTHTVLVAVDCIAMRTALFLFGGWEGHHPRQCCEIYAPLVESVGLRAELADSLAAFDDAAHLRSLAVIVPCWTMGVLTPQQEQNLLDAVRAGVGIAGWHGGMGDAFRNSTGYQFLTGGQFVAHPGDIVRYRVNISDRDHPITRGIPDFDVASEQYYMHVDPSNRVLATTTFPARAGFEWIAGTVMPVVWTRAWGNGRVFYSSIGHQPSDFDAAEPRTLTVRGILWAARLDGEMG